MKIGIDIDGVITNFVDEFIKIVKKRYGIKIVETDIIYHDLYQVLGISEKEALKIIDETLHNNLKVIPHAKKYINLLSKNNEIYILTARTINIKIIEKWLEENRDKI